MAVKVFCSACDKFIKNVDGVELQKLTGKEKCEECGKKIQELYQVLDEKVKHYNAELDQMLGLAKKKYSTFDAAHSKFLADAQSLYTTTKAEIDSQLQNILEGKE